jgi:hypothetical protein
MLLIMGSRRCQYSRREGGREVDARHKRQITASCPLPPITMAEAGPLPSPPPQIRDLLGCTFQDQQIDLYLQWLSASSESEKSTTPIVKAYSDSVYFNYYSLGISIMCTPSDGYKPKTNASYENLQLHSLTVDSIDLYNTPSASASKTKPDEHRTFAGLPLSLTLSEGLVADQPRPSEIKITSESTGKDFVSAFGEPARKGGGSGPSSGSINIWCEWSKDGVMVEFAGGNARGPQAWEKGKDAVWKVITLFALKE